MCTAACQHVGITVQLIDRWHFVNMWHFMTDGMYVEDVYDRWHLCPRHQVRVLHQLGFLGCRVYAYYVVKQTSYTWHADVVYLFYEGKLYEFAYSITIRVSTTCSNIATWTWRKYPPGILNRKDVAIDVFSYM